MTSTTSRPQRAARPWGAGALVSRLDSPVTSYYVLVGATAVLVVIGLVMVLSASMVTSYQDDGSSFAVFIKQAQFAVIGLVATVVAARLPVAWWKRLALPALVGALLLQLLVFTPLGVTVNGNRNWLRFSSALSFQPSELTKLGLVLVGALVFANKGRRVRTLHQIVVPYLVPISLVTIGLVLLGHDLGTALVLLGIVGAVLWAAGVPSRFFLATAAAAALGAALLVVTSATRMGRITNWLSGSCNDPDGACGQSVHGLYALADGGWWGVGLGASKEKWAWLAEAQNDFIFAIIGEELGLPGTLSLLILFAMIAAACYRIVYRARDPFVRIATAGVMAWLMLQTIINVGGVIGLLPVVGVPLPLVSAGGSALVTTMVAMGMLISFARSEPGASEILSTRPSVVRRSLAVLPGRRRRR
ncbi:MAG: putative lipid II flippase FtsW [Dermatophilaceae bacterium]